MDLNLEKHLHYGARLAWGEFGSMCHGATPPEPAVIEALHLLIQVQIMNYQGEAHIMQRSQPFVGSGHSDGRPGGAAQPRPLWRLSRGVPRRPGQRGGSGFCATCLLRVPGAPHGLYLLHLPCTRGGGKAHDPQLGKCGKRDGERLICRW